MCHLPPCGVRIPRLFNSRAMAWMETKPAFRRLRIVGPKASARASAARLFINSLLIPSCPGSRRRRILTTVLRCHLPPLAVGIPLRFNSSANARRDIKPAAIASRTVETKSRARKSAARLLANAPCIPLLWEELFPRSRSIGQSWLQLSGRPLPKNTAMSVGRRRPQPGSYSSGPAMVSSVAASNVKSLTGNNGSMQNAPRGLRGGDRGCCFSLGPLACQASTAGWQGGSPTQATRGTYSGFSGCSE